MHIVTEEAATRAVSAADALSAMRQAFAALESGEAAAFPVTAGHGTAPSTAFGAKPGLILPTRLVGLKVGTNWGPNRGNGLPSHGSTTLLLDDRTGFLRALISSSHLTALRTAAVDAMAVDLLARRDATTLGIVGAGHQAWFDLSAVLQVRPIEAVLVWNREAGQAQRFAERAAVAFGLPVTSAGLEAVVRRSEILLTVTSAREPLIEAGWVQPGTHISAMGADARGKQELAIEVSASGRLFADVVEQSISIGEFEAAHAAGRVEASQVQTIGSVLVGGQAGREADEEITIFDSSGTGIQDLAIGAVALERAIAAGETVEIDLSYAMAS